MNDDKLRTGFLAGVGILGILIVGGLVWAIVAGPSPVRPNDIGKPEEGLVFKDDNDPAQGPGEAKVIVRMFSDLQCPACKSAEPGLEYAMATYAKQVRFIWDDFPLSQIHQNAMAAANAARCAEEQGKFWEFRKKLYETQAQWAELAAPTTAFAGFADALGMNRDGFLACASAQTYSQKIRDDMSEADANRVDGTPTFFVNNTRYVGALTNAQWDTAITNILGASSTKP